MISKNMGYKIAIGAMLGLIVIMGWFLLRQGKQNKNLIEEKNIEFATEKENITSQLDSLIMEHNRVKDQFGTVSSELHLKDSIINVKANEIKTLLNVKSELSVVKQKLANLQQITKGYVREIDSLNRINKNLVNENTQIKKDFNIEQQKTKVLEQDKQELSEKLTDAAVLKAYKVTATPLNQRGLDKIRVTDKANRTNVIKVCFTVSENSLVTDGYTRFFIRIARPDNMILTRSDEYIFNFLGQDLQFSCMQTLNYEGEAVDVCSQYEHPANAEPLPKGVYHVNIFTENREIGQTVFELK